MELIQTNFIIFLIVRVAVLVLFVFYLVNLQKTLETVSFHNREVTPGLVWLSFIPLFNLVWFFVLNIKISNSIKKELEQRQGVSDYDNYAMIAGIVLPCIMILSVILALVRDPFPYAGKLVELAVLIAIAVHWYQTAGYKRQIREMGENLNVKNDLLDGF